MAGLSNSSIQPWLDFRGDNLPTDIPLCQTINKHGYLVEDNCTAVCNDTMRIIHSHFVNNLLTCGVWSTLTMMDYYYANTDSIGTGNHPQTASLLKRFEPLGLDAGNKAYVYAAVDAVSTCMNIMESATRIGTYEDVTLPQRACNQQSLFPNFQVGYVEEYGPRLRRCVDAICAPRTLNPDLGGVGVFISLLIQLSIAILVSIALVGLEFRPSSREKTAKRHTLALSTALIEFHKSQCYFISAIMIAALVLDSQVYKLLTQKNILPTFDVSLSTPLSLNGIVPVVFTLCCVTRYGRMTWHIITLSTISVALSTGTLAASYNWILNITAPATGNIASMNSVDGGPLAEIVCGSRASNLDRIVEGSPLVWVVYTNCFAWGVWCVTKHILTDPPEGSRRHRVLDLCSSFIPKSAHNRSARLVLARLGYSSFIVTWSFCFIYHIYLYSLFIRYSLVSPSWTFGQIIAVAVWIPSVVEFCYIEYEGPEEASKYKYPPGLQVFKTLVRPSVGLANFELRPPSTADPLLSRRDSSTNPSA